MELQWSFFFSVYPRKSCGSSWGASSHTEAFGGEYQFYCTSWKNTSHLRWTMDDEIKGWRLKPNPTEAHEGHEWTRDIHHYAGWFLGSRRRGARMKLS